MKLNEYIFGAIFTFIALGVTALVVAGGGGITAAELISTKLFNAAIPLALSLGFIFSLRGTKYDVLEEIFDQKNIAAAIFVYAFVDLFVRAFSRG